MSAFVMGSKGHPLDCLAVTQCPVDTWIV